MTDIVRRLRFAFDSGVPLRLSQDGVSAERDPLCKEAADEIERLRAEVASLKLAVEDYGARYVYVPLGQMVDRHTAPPDMVFVPKDFEEGVRKDAERYRWLRSDSRVSRWDVRYWTGEFWDVMYGKAMDDQIDAALWKEKS